jgi:predicted enzyme related to lactoylglutathione lyase
MTETVIAWFEIPASDLARAADFYGNVLGANMVEMDAPNGKMMAFMNGEEPVGALSSSATSSDHGVSVYFSAADIDAALAKVREKGGKVLTEKTSIGPFGFIAQFTDTEGNNISLHSRT